MDRCRHGNGGKWMASSVLTFYGCIYIPDWCDLRHHIIMQYHDSWVTGHLGHKKTLELISHDYWWPQISRQVRQYTWTCKVCLWNKVLQCQLIGLLNPLPIPKGCWE